MFKFMSLLNANAVLGGWCLGVGGFEADALTGVGGGLAMVCWGSTKASGGGSGIGHSGVLTAGAVAVGTVLVGHWPGGFWSWLIGCRNS